jgi:5'-3' exonuclease
MNFILIDGSYYLFYRYYALNVWWKNANADKPLGTEGMAPIECEEFVQKFKETVVSKVDELAKKLKIAGKTKGKNQQPHPIIYVARDCKRSEIWRNEIYSEYKGTRESDPNFAGAPFFKLAYVEQLFEKTPNVKGILKHDKLEADDCIALTAKHLHKTYPDANIYIIASDADYLQIVNDKIHLYDMKYKNIKETKKCSGDPKRDLFCKIVAGDKSDNIPTIMKKLGPKTAQKYYENPTEFETFLAKNPQAKEVYKRNQTIVDFNNIPQDLQISFEQLVISKL